MTIPPWLGLASHIVGATAVHVLLPWALSRTAVRHGWTGGLPDLPNLPNLAGLLLVGAGFWVYAWSARQHFLQAPQGWKVEKTAHYPTPAYLLTGGPYRYSRHPLYLAELCIWIGWMIFYGSLALVAIFAAGALIMGPLVLRREERGLEARFGDAYREYRLKTGWLGRP